jgi:transcriptional regulator with XRE-family HTH domain
VETIGERVRAEREAQKLSRPALARAAGIAPTTLSDLELGLSKSTTALHKIADRLGVRVEWLETGKGEKVASQSAGLDDATMAKAVEMVYLLADARPEDRRWDRPQWMTFKVAAKAIVLAKGDMRKAMAALLEEI